MASPAAAPVPPQAPAKAVPRDGMTSRVAAGFVMVLLTCLSGAELGLWFIPFVLGVTVGVFAPRSRGAVVTATVLTVTGGAVAGWAVALWIMALNGLPVGATARAIAALAGLPPYAAVAIAVTLLLAAMQTLAGSWLARAVFPRQLRLPFPRRAPGGPRSKPGWPRRAVSQPAATPHQADPQP